MMILEREDDRIRTGGYNICPIEIEEGMAWLAKWDFMRRGEYGF